MQFFISSVALPAFIALLATPLTGATPVIGATPEIGVSTSLAKRSYRYTCHDDQTYNAPYYYATCENGSGGTTRSRLDMNHCFSNNNGVVQYTDK